MKIKTSEFIKSSSVYTECPPADKPEYAFIGRSNVGKSSLINALTGRKSLAKTSQKPGKTQLINHFIVNDAWYLVDLPGYGWAQVSKAKRHTFAPMIHDYLLNRPNLMGIFTLIDIRLEPQAIDLDFLEFLGENALPFVMLFTKADKLTRNKQNASVQRYRKTLLQNWEEMPHHYITSAQTGLGCPEVLNFIHEVNENEKTA